MPPKRSPDESPNRDKHKADEASQLPEEEHAVGGLFSQAMQMANDAIQQGVAEENELQKESPIVDDSNISSCEATQPEEEHAGGSLFAHAMQMANDAIKRGDAAEDGLQKESPIADDSSDSNSRGFMDRFSAPTALPADLDATISTVGAVTEGNHPHRAQKSLSERHHNDQVQALLEAAAGTAPPRLAKAILTLGPVVAKIAAAIDKVGPPTLVYWQKIMTVMDKLPQSALRSLYGLALCFFGGIFANTIAAVEAFKQSGYERARTCFHDLRIAASEVYAANAQDNLRDDNRDGIADVDQINKRELLSRKMVLFIRTVDPTVLQQAFIGLYQGLIGVLATLKFKFAKSVALGLSIGNMAKRPLAVILAPTLKNILKPEDCKKWSPMIVNYTSKLVAMIIAFAVQSRISAIQSAAMGGQIFARSLLQLGRERGLVNASADETYMDEVVGWSVAVIGIWSQLASGMRLRFPLNVMLFPLSLVEWILRWLVVAAPGSVRTTSTQATAVS